MAGAGKVSVPYPDTNWDSMNQKEFGIRDGGKNPDLSLPDTEGWQAKGMRNSLQVTSYNTRFTSSGLEGTWMPGFLLFTLGGDDLYTPGDLQHMIRSAFERKWRKRRMEGMDDANKREYAKSFIQKQDEKMDTILTDMNELRKIVRPAGSVYGNPLPYNQVGRTQSGIVGYKGPSVIAINPEKYVVNVPMYSDTVRSLPPRTKVFVTFKHVSVKVAAPYTDARGTPCRTMLDEAIDWDKDTVIEPIFTTTLDNRVPDTYDELCRSHKFTQPPVDFRGFKTFDSNGDPVLDVGLTWEVGFTTQPHAGSTATDFGFASKKRRSLANDDVKHLETLEMHLTFRLIG